jgi:agmatine deiminase
VLVQTAPPENPNHERCAENVQRLDEAGYETIAIPHLSYREVAGERVAVGYLNLYICNGAVIVPTATDEYDEEAIAIIGEALPGRSVVPVAGATLAYGGGGPHCITQQVPAL